MSLTPMAVDSPIGLNGVSQKPSGVPNTMATAKLSELMPLYRPTKVGISSQLYQQIS